MGLRFRRSIKIAPGLKLNINKNSVGLSAGVKGAHISVNSKGRVTKSVGIPGTGISYVETSNLNKGKNKRASKTKPLNKNYNTAPIIKEPCYTKSWFSILFLILFFPVGLCTMWKYTKWPIAVKKTITAIFILLMLVSLIIDK